MLMMNLIKVLIGLWIDAMGVYVYQIIKSYYDFCDTWETNVGIYSSLKKAKSKLKELDRMNFNSNTNFYIRKEEIL